MTLDKDKKLDRDKSYLLSFNEEGELIHEELTPEVIAKSLFDFPDFRDGFKYWLDQTDFKVSKGEDETGRILTYYVSDKKHGEFIGEFTIYIQLCNCEMTKEEAMTSFDFVEDFHYSPYTKLESKEGVEILSQIIDDYYDYVKGAITYRAICLHQDYFQLSDDEMEAIFDEFPEIYDDDNGYDGDFDAEE